MTILSKTPVAKLQYWASDVLIKIPSAVWMFLESLSQRLFYVFTVKQFVLATIPLRFTTSVFFQLNICCSSYFVIPSLTSGWICSLQQLLTLASAVILRSGSFRTRDPDFESDVAVKISHNLELNASIQKFDQRQCKGSLRCE